MLFKQFNNLIYNFSFFFFFFFNLMDIPFNNGLFNTPLILFFK